LWFKLLGFKFWQLPDGFAFPITWFPLRFFASFAVKTFAFDPR